MLELNWPFGLSSILKYHTFHFSLFIFKSNSSYNISQLKFPLGLSTPLSPPPNPVLPSDPLLLHFFWEKSKRHPWISAEQGITKYSKTRLRPYCQDWTKQNGWSKKVPSGGKRVRDIPTPIVLCHQNTKSTTINIYGEDLVQTQVDSVIVYQSLWSPMSAAFLA